MGKIKIFFENVISAFEFVFVILLLIFGYPFYKKTLKEIWELIIKHEQYNPAIRRVRGDSG